MSHKECLKLATSIVLGLCSLLAEYSAFNTNVYITAALAATATYTLLSLILIKSEDY
jgi:hypothetical protein